MVTSGRNHILVFTLIGTSRNEMGALAAGLTPRQMQAAHQRTAE
jgi:hypothetical protein